MPLENCINYMLSISQNAVFQYFSQQLLPFHITPAQYGILSCLWNEEPLSPKQIGKQLHLEASTISTLLEKMQNNGLIIRNIDPNNRRAIQVFLTQKAIDLKTPVEKTVFEMNDYILKDFSADEKQILFSILSTIIDKYSKHSK